MTTILIRKTNLAEQCYDVVRRQMLEGGRYRPGEKISVEGITRELGVSRSPVWAAINRLAAEGMVEVRPRDGVFFLGFDERHLAELFAVREELEAMAARLAAHRRDVAATDRLFVSLARQRQAVSLGDGDAYAREGAAFHDVLVELAGNAVLAETLDRILAQIKLLCMTRVAGSDGQAAFVAEHQKIAEAIAAGDAAAADAAVRIHVQGLARTL